MTPSISQRLGNCPSDFLTAYNPDRANNIIAKGYTPGEVAMLPDTPTLADVSAKFDESTAIKWLTIQIDSADIIGGTKAFPEEARYSLASLLLAAYGYLNIGEFLLFFARYRLGDYTDIPVGGLQKISAALRRYVDNRNLDIRRIEREQYNRQQEAMRREWAAKAISYEEYIKPLGLKHQRPMNISQTYLKHKGYPTDSATDETILAPFILADSAYVIYEDYIKPLGLKHQFKQHQNNFMRCCRALTKDFFAAFDADQTEYILDKMDALHDGIRNDIEILRFSVMKHLSEFPDETKENIASLAVLVHLTQSARILFGELFKVRTYRGVEPMRNKDLDGMVSYSCNLFRAYTLQYARNSEIIDLNEVKDIAAASRILCNNILKNFNLYNHGK